MFYTPRCLTEGLVSVEDCNRLASVTLQHRETWDGFDEYPTLPLFTIGSPVYRATSWEHYVAARAKSSIFLTVHTRWLKNRMIEQLQNALRREGKPLSGSSDFGMHVFSNCNGLRESKYSLQSYHRDHDVLRMYPNVGIRSNSIFSFIVPIAIPESGAGLDWRLAEPDKQRLTYKLGDMYVWNGSVEHKFSDLQLNGDETRITFQGHGFIANEHTFYYYW